MTQMKRSVNILHIFKGIYTRWWGIEIIHNPAVLQCSYNYSKIIQKCKTSHRTRGRTKLNDKRNPHLCTHRCQQTIRPYLHTGFFSASSWISGKHRFLAYPVYMCEFWNKKKNKTCRYGLMDIWPSRSTIIYAHRQ